MQKQHRRWLHLLRKGPHIHLLASSVNHGPDLDRSGRPPYMVVATSIALVYIHLLGSNYSCRQSYYSLDCVNIEPRRTMNPPKERRQPHKHLSWPGRAPVGFIGLTSPHRIITQTYRSLVEAFGQPATIQSHERRTTSRTLTFFVCPIGGFILLCFSWWFVMILLFRFFVFLSLEWCLDCLPSWWTSFTCPPSFYDWDKFLLSSLDVCGNGQAIIMCPSALFGWLNEVGFSLLLFSLASG